MEESALRSVLSEGDCYNEQEVMVVCISAILVPGPETVVEVTDGWYALPAACDAALSAKITDGTVSLGGK